MVALAKTDNKIKVLLMSENNEWYTPSRYIEAARLVMGGIDLDPASCEMANQIVQSTTYYTKEDNGLSKPFYGRIWCNPPYGFTNGKSNQGLWVRKLVDEYERGNVEQAVLLVNAVTDRTWFHLLWQFPICFTDHRIAFYSPDKRVPAPTHGNALVYFGSRESRFIEVFSQFGRIARAIDMPKPAPTTLWENIWTSKNN